MSDTDMPAAEGPREAGIRAHPRPSPFAGDPALREGLSGTPGRSHGNAIPEWPGCAPGVATMIAALLGIPLWIAVTYLILPAIHETTPLAYGVATTLLVFLTLEFRAIALGGLVTPKAPPAIPLDPSTRFQPQPISSAVPCPPDQKV